MIAFLTTISVAGCATGGLGSEILGTWQLANAGATAAYTFEVDGRFTFDGQSNAGQLHLGGAWSTDGTLLTLTFDDHPSVAVPYTLDGDKLVITDDPATVVANSHATATYTRR